MSVKKLNLLFIKCMLYFFFVTASSGNNDTNKKKYGRGDLASSPRGILRQIMVFEVADFIPEYFDAREKWPQCPSIGRVEDQDGCNSIAVATAWALTDRWCISSNGSDQFEFSAGDILTCSSVDLTWVNATTHRCEFTGSFNYAIENWIRVGIVSGSGRGLMKGCKPYSTIVQKNGTVPAAAGKCKHKCTNPDYRTPYSQDKRSGLGYGLWSYSIDGAEKILQTEIMNYGPVLTSMNSTNDFVENGGRGIYRVLKERPEDGEVTKLAVKIIGWGREDARPYWLLANTRGPKWGAEKGFFKLLRGVNHLGIEERVHIPSVKERHQSEDPSTHSPKRQSSAASILNSMVTVYFTIFNMFMYLYV